MPEHTYNPTDARVVDSWAKAHDNGDRTDVIALELDTSQYAVIGIDSYPSDYKPLTTTLIDVLPTEGGARTRAEAYLEGNPKGVDPDHDKGRLRKLLNGGGGK